MRIVKGTQKINMRNLLFFLFIFIGTSLIAQPETAQKEVVNGKNYYVHFVQSGNTLWGIHKLYDVPVEEIVKANPGSVKGVNEGQKLLIPVPLVTVDHVVQSKETLFAISKKYGVTVDAIVVANPGADKGVNEGQVLHIPGVEREIATKNAKPDQVKQEITPDKTDSVPARETIKVSFSDSVINHVVLDHETLYSISKRFMVPVEELQKLNNLKSSKIKPGETIKIPVKKEKVEVVKVRQVETQVEVRKVDSTLLFPKRSKYKIAILLPFYLDKTDKSTENISNLATEFYMGAKLAIDSLEKLGLVADVYVYDAKNDTNAVKAILKKPELMGVDLLFGPLFPESVDVASRWCKANNIRMVCPTSVNPSVLKNNPFVYNAVPSDATLMKGLAEYTLKNNPQHQIILIKSSNDKDLIMYESFRNTFMSAPVSGARPKLIEATLENYASFLKKGVNTVLVFPTNEKLMAVKFMNSFNDNATKLLPENISIYGTKEWMNFDEVKPHFRDKYNFHFANPNDLNYKYQVTENLHRKYRSNYNADMSKMAVQGFDVVYFFCSELLMGRKVGKGIMNDFQMVQKGSENGYENSRSFIFEQEEFELINVGK
jgi:LysM repeat protein